MNPKAKWLAIIFGAIGFAAFMFMGFSMASSLDALPRALMPILVESAICGLVAASIGYAWGKAFPPRARIKQDSE